EALRDLSSPRALVIRDGERMRIAGREVVRGDILVLSEGDRVAADAVVLSSVNLSVDESLLTGESVPVRKTPGNPAQGIGPPGGDDLPFVYSGSLVVYGRALAQVKATGVNSRIGGIGRILQTVHPGQTLLQRQTARLVRLLAAAGMLFCLLVVAVYGITRGDWLRGVLAGLTLAMALLPEEFPVVLTVFLALGAWRISRRRVLTRSAPAVETLGGATVLCVDKTGTLTINRMTVTRIFAHDEDFDLAAHPAGPLPEPFHELAEFSILASQRDPFDPMEKAIHQLGEDFLADTEHIHRDWTLLHEYPLSPELLALSHVFRSPDGRGFLIAAKGAPEAIVDLCHLPAPELERVLRRAEAMAADGLRVLGVARAGFAQSDLPSGQHDFAFEFLGLIGLADPVRPNVRDAVAECRTAGIRVVMITGDHPATARSIARQIGLAVEDVITGTELDTMSEATLREQLRTTVIFARAIPEHKLRLVNALKANGEIVAMTGDGVNDAPALRAADIGIAMGGRGTDVARESADLVLLDDDFASIVEAVRLGRRIYDNLTKAMAYVFAVHIPIAGMSLLPVLFGWPLVLLPVHIGFLELIIDPACSVVFEAVPEEENVMRRPPRSATQQLFGWPTLWRGLLQGLGALAITAGLFAFLLYSGRGESEVRTVAFTGLTMVNLAMIGANLSRSQSVFAALREPNAALRWVIGGSLATLALVIVVPWLRGWFYFSTIGWKDVAICAGAGAAGWIWFSLVKIKRA
ncbi:MAG: cation-translocating P-type ATPase, partial [Bryobacteraceae bacterium]